MAKIATSTTSLGSVLDENESTIILEAIGKVKAFYNEHPEIKPSHGWDHVSKVFHHASKALQSLMVLLHVDDEEEETTTNKNETCTSSSTDASEQEQKVTQIVRPSPSASEAIEIKLAALLHDVDDKKYFPKTKDGEYPNASTILDSVKLSSPSSSVSKKNVLKMISWVSCSQNGNKVPKEVQTANSYHLLIPRWADRLEAVGSRGVVRCYQYSIENNRQLSLPDLSPRPKSEEELWRYCYNQNINNNTTSTATTTTLKQSKLQEYTDRGGSSTDMISHYYDKLLHIARPPKNIVQNPYLEHMAEESSRDLVEVCLQYGKTGVVDEEYIKSLAL